jgi:hypothetical protein
VSDDDVYYAAEEIRNQAIHLNVASENWKKAWQNIRAAKLPSDALGKIGEEAGYAQEFNSYAEQVVQKLWSGSQSLSSGVDGLHKVANTYEHNEYRSTQNVESVRPDLGL